MSVLQKWVRSEGVSDTDRAATGKVLDLLAAQVVTGDQTSAAVRSPEPQRRGRSGGAGSGGGTGLAGKALPVEVAARCEGTFGDWCGGYLTQEPISARVSHSCTLCGNQGRFVCMLYSAADCSCLLRAAPLSPRDRLVVGHL